jgi:hypothetical protein
VCMKQQKHVSFVHFVVVFFCLMVCVCVSYLSCYRREKMTSNGVVMINKIHKRVAAMEARAQESEKKTGIAVYVPRPLLHDPNLVMDGIELGSLCKEWAMHVGRLLTSISIAKKKWGDDKITVNAFFHIEPHTETIACCGMYIPKPKKYAQLATDATLYNTYITRLRLALQARFENVCKHIASWNAETGPPTVDFYFSLHGVAGFGVALVEVWDGYPEEAKEMIEMHQRMIKEYMVAKLRHGRYISASLVVVGRCMTADCLFTPLTRQSPTQGFMKRKTFDVLMGILGSIVRRVVGESKYQDLLAAKKECRLQYDE